MPGPTEHELKQAIINGHCPKCGDDLDEHNLPEARKELECMGCSWSCRFGVYDKIFRVEFDRRVSEGICPECNGRLVPIQHKGYSESHCSNPACDFEIDDAPGRVKFGSGYY